MEIKNIHEHAGWFASYMNAPDAGNDAQGKALVECQSKKIQQLLEILQKVKGEIELAEDPKEVDAEIVLQSIKDLITDVPKVEHTEGYFKWEG